MYLKKRQRDQTNNLVSVSSVHLFFIVCNVIINNLQVLNEFTHGSQEKVSKTEFKEVLSDILLGMAAGLKRDPIVILRMDGEDLSEFIHGPGYEIETVSIFSELSGSEDSSLRDCIVKALQSLSVDHGMPPSSDPWVIYLLYLYYIYIYTCPSSCMFDVICLLERSELHLKSKVLVSGNEQHRRTNCRLLS